MSIGMSYDEYWNSEGIIAKYYREANELKRRQRNQELWLQGAYIYEALCDVAPILQAFAKKGTKVQPYASEPYPLSEKEQRERELAKEKEKMEAWRKMFASFASSFNKKLKTKKEG